MYFETPRKRRWPRPSSTRKRTDRFILNRRDDVLKTHRQILINAISIDKGEKKKNSILDRLSGFSVREKRSENRTNLKIQTTDCSRHASTITYTERKAAIIVLIRSQQDFRLKSTVPLRISFILSVEQNASLPSHSGNDCDYIVILLFSEYFRSYLHWYNSIFDWKFIFDDLFTNIVAPDHTLCFRGDFFFSPSFSRQKDKATTAKSRT